MQGRRVSLLSSVMNVMNAIMGSGILALPSVMAEVGMAVYVLLQLTMMGIVDFSLHLLVCACRARNVYSYEELGEAAFGINGKRFVCLTILSQKCAAPI